jgi:hypothetical protein
VSLRGKVIKIGLADFGDFHPDNYRIGTELGQTLKLAPNHSLTITIRLNITITHSCA